MINPARKLWDLRDKTSHSWINNYSVFIPSIMPFGVIRNINNLLLREMENTLDQPTKSNT